MYRIQPMERKRERRRKRLCTGHYFLGTELITLRLSSHNGMGRYQKDIVYDYLPAPYGTGISILFERIKV